MSSITDVAPVAATRTPEGNPAGRASRGPVPSWGCSPG
jgi:hypothetical protein